MIKSAKVAITLDRAENRYPNRSKAIQAAVVEKLDQNRLARECGKLDSKFEQALAEEGMSGEPGEWSEY